MANAEKHIGPLDFDHGCLAENWARWKELILLVFDGPQSSKWKESEKAAYFLISIGQKGRDICRAWVSSDVLSEEDKMKTGKLIEMFDAYCNPRKNTTVQRKLFYERNQGVQEPLEEWITQLRLLVKDCSFHEPDDMIKDRIVLGTNSKDVQEKLLREDDLTLDKAKKIAQAYEISRAQMKEINKECDKEIHSVKGGKGKNSKVRQRNFQAEKSSKKNTLHWRGERNPPGKGSCSRCGKDHTRQDTCPAIGKVCFKCSKKGHFSQMCKSKADGKVQGVEQDSYHEHSYEGSDDFVLNTVTCDLIEESEVLVHIKLGPSQQRVQFKLDTGAQVNCIPASLYNSILAKSVKLEKPGLVKLSGYGGHQLDVLGKCRIKCRYQELSKPLEFYIVNTSSKPVLGLPACNSMNLIKMNVNAEVNIKNANQTKMTKEFVLDKYADVFRGLGELKGECSIKIKEDAVPVIHPPRRIPFTMRDRVKKELERMENMGVLKRVDQPTEWVSSMVAVEKKGTDKIRICLDPSDLNKAIMREHYPLPILEDITSKISGTKYFSKLDASSGYWQVKLDEESSKLTTFNTPFGRWCFSRMPFGIVSAQEIFQKKAHEVLENLDGVHVIIDDILVTGETREEHDRNLSATLQRCRERKLKLNPDKLEIGVEEIIYFGHKFTAKGLQPDPNKVEAIRQMSSPTSKKELETVLGMVTYLAKFAPKLSEITAPLRHLLKKESVWLWDANMESVFNKVKVLLTQSPGPVLQYFNPTKEVTLQVDASQYGLGCVLMQEGRPVAYSSRAMTATQRNYAQIEKEMLAIVTGCEKFHQYIYGRGVTIETDHKPLENILRKPMFSTPPRLQRMQLRLHKYDLNVVYKPGKEIPIADSLSRSSNPNEAAEDDESLNELVHTVWNNVPVTDEKLQGIKNETAQDESMKILVSVIQQGWPTKKSDVPVEVRDYWPIKHELSVINGVVFKGENVVIPKVLRSNILSKIHTGHLGIVLCKRRARDLVYWPGMCKEIHEMISSCTTCSEYQSSNPREPMHSSEVPQRPWQRLASDLFTWNNKNYVLIVDYYSRYFEVVQLRNTLAATVIEAIQSMLARHGVCDELVTDNGPQYSSREFTSFVSTWGIKHTLTSPYHPKANGLAEKYVQIAKNIMKKSKQNVYLGLLSYRTTPSDDLASPGQLLMGRRLKSNIPTAEAKLEPRVIDPCIVKESRQRERDLQKKYHDRTAKSLPQLEEGDRAWLQRLDKRWESVKVFKAHDTPRSFTVVTQDGRQYRRNRSVLRKSAVLTKNTEVAQPRQGIFKQSSNEAQPRTGCPQKNFTCLIKYSRKTKTAITIK